MVAIAQLAEEDALWLPEFAHHLARPVLLRKHPASGRQSASRGAAGGEAHSSPSRSAGAGGPFQTLGRSHFRKLGMAYGQKPAPELSALEAQLEVVKLWKKKLSLT